MSTEGRRSSRRFSTYPRGGGPWPGLDVALPAPDVVRGIGNEASKRRGVGNGGGGGRVNWMSEAQSCGLHLSFEGAESRFIFSNVPSSSHFHFSPLPLPLLPSFTRPSSANLVIRGSKPLSYQCFLWKSSIPSANSERFPFPVRSIFNLERIWNIYIYEWNGEWVGLIFRFRR